MLHHVCSGERDRPGRRPNGRTIIACHITNYRTARVLFSERYENRPDVKALQAWVEFQRPQHKPET